VALRLRLANHAGALGLVQHKAHTILKVLHGTVLSDEEAPTVVLVPFNDIFAPSILLAHVLTGLWVFGCDYLARRRATLVTPTNFPTSGADKLERDSRTLTNKWCQPCWTFSNDLIFGRLDFKD